MVRTRLSAADGGHWAAGYTRSLLHRPGKRLSPPFIVRQFHTRVACRLHRAALPPTKYGTNRFGLSVNVYDEAIVKIVVACVIVCALYSFLLGSGDYSNIYIYLTICVCTPPR